MFVCSVSSFFLPLPMQGPSGHELSGQELSGQDDSGQEDGESSRTPVSPDLMYDVPRSLLEPPSPLVEFNQVGVVSCKMGVVFSVEWVWSTN